MADLAVYVDVVPSGGRNFGAPDVIFYRTLVLSRGSSLEAKSSQALFRQRLNQNAQPLGCGSAIREQNWIIECGRECLGTITSCINDLTNHCDFGYTTLLKSKPPERDSYCAAKPTKGDTTMNNVKKIAVSLLILGVMTGFAQARHHESRPDATLRLRWGSFALGIGGSSGSGTLTYRGKSYPVRVRGLSVGKVGMTSSSANGDVFNLRRLQDFNGHYNVGGAGTRGVTLGSGRTGTIMSNQAGVIVRIFSTQQGVAVNATGGGMDMQLQ